MTLKLSGKKTILCWLSDLLAKYLLPASCFRNFLKSTLQLLNKHVEPVTSETELLTTASSAAPKSVIVEAQASVKHR